MTEGFKVQFYLKVRAASVLQKTAPSKKKKLSSKRDPILALGLRELRDDISKAENIPHFQIFTQDTLYAICDSLPRTEKELLKVNGMGKIRVKKYGDEILELITLYCKENGINTFNEQKNEDKKSTKQISFELFKKGLSVKEIATERSLTTGTIESHLASYIPSGEIDVLELIPLKRYQKMRKEIEAVEYKNLTHLKENVDKSYSFMELRMVLLSLNQEI
jgi:ribonuclease D